MKQFFTLFASLLMLASISSFAQPAHQPKGQRGQGKPDKEQMAAKTAERLAARMNLDEATKADFVPLYTEYKKECIAVTEANRVKINMETASDEEIDRHIRASFVVSREVQKVRETYYDKFLKVLTPRQIKYMYKTEKEMQPGGKQPGGKGPKETGSR